MSGELVASMEGITTMKSVLVMLLMLLAVGAFVAAAFGASGRLTNVGLALFAGAGLVETLPF